VNGGQRPGPGRLGRDPAYLVALTRRTPGQMEAAHTLRDLREKAGLRPAPPRVHLGNAAVEVLATAKAQHRDPAEVVRVLLVEDAQGRNIATVAAQPANRPRPRARHRIAGDSGRSQGPAPRVSGRPHTGVPGGDEGRAWPKPARSSTVTSLIGPGSAAGSVTNRCGSAGPVAHVDQSAVEGTLLDQLEIEAHAVGEEPLAAADHARGDEQVVLVHQAGRDRLGREVRTVDG
jgi:hypothetical protein